MTFTLNGEPPRPKKTFKPLSQGGTQLTLFRGLNDVPGQTEFGFIEEETETSEAREGVVRSEPSD